MKMPKRSLVALWAAGAFLWLAAGAIVQAQRYSGNLSRRGYEEMRALAQQLDERAQHSNDVAQHQDYWVYRYNSRFVRAVGDFAYRTRRFDERMANYRTAPWRVDDELRSLLRSAQNVQSLARGSRAAEEHTLADWNDTVQILNRMIRLYDFDVRGSGRYEWGTPYAGSPGPETRGGYYPPAPGGPGDYGARLASLSRELVQRASRAHQMAEDAPGGSGGWRHQYFENIHRFDDQARDFDARLQSGQLGRQGAREEARRLLDDARRADAEMRRNNVFPEVWDEWRGAIQTLERILEVTGA